MPKRTSCDGCGAPIVLFLLVPEVASKSKRASFVPMDVDFDLAMSKTPPSHALSAGRQTCRALSREHELQPHEHPALTHFATCPARAQHASEESP